MGRLHEVAAYGDLVAHGAREDEKAGFVGGKRSHRRFEGGSGGILKVDVIEKGGGLDCLEHAQGRGSDGVAPEVIRCWTRLMPGIVDFCLWGKSAHLDGDRDGEE